MVRPPAQQDPRLPPAHRTFNAGDGWALRRVKQLYWTLKYSLAATHAKAPAISTIEMSGTQFISRTVFKENTLASSEDLGYMSTSQTTISTKAAARLGWVMTRSNTPCHVGKTSRCRGRQSMTTHFKRWWQLCLKYIQGALCRLDVPSAHRLLCVRPRRGVWTDDWASVRVFLGLGSVFRRRSSCLLSGSPTIWQSCHEVQIRLVINPSNSSREVVRTWVTFYKKHREVLGADLVHVRRPNMQVGKAEVCNAMSDCTETKERHLNSISHRSCLISGHRCMASRQPKWKRKGPCNGFQPHRWSPTFRTFFSCQQKNQSQHLLIKL